MGSQGRHPEPLPSSRPRAAVLVLEGMLTRADVAPLCAHGQDLSAEDGVVLLVCDTERLTAPDAITIDLLARLQLIATRYDCELQVRRPGPTLQALIMMSGLGAILTG